MLSTEDLRVFVVIAEEGSFSRAATRLHLAQASISEKIARLERHVGADLFVRTNRGVDLTAAGRTLLPYAHRCMSLCEEAVKAVKVNDADTTFRVLMHSSYAPVIMPFLIDVLASVPLMLSNNDAHSEDVVRAVASDRADVGFTIAMPHPHNVRLEPFYADRVICVASPEHDLAGAGPICVADLANYFIAVNQWGDGCDQFLDLLRSAPVSASHLRTVSPAETAANLARLRSHVAVCTRSTLDGDLMAGRLVELDVRDLPLWVVELFLVWRVADTATPAVQTLRDAISATDGEPLSWIRRTPAPQGGAGRPVICSNISRH